MDSNVRNEVDELREELQSGAFGTDTSEESDGAADDTVVADFLAKFGVEGDTPLKAHDWKVYMPSSIVDNPNFWGPLFGVFKKES